ncbi:MAG TPA: phage tail sheath subtilisin-like domain-containing protein [Thermomicrobiales bacterium]|nr:phage tail sheath subtilisin-like domain-containing protein [Thermomicrobiales bacterium]
MPSDYYSPGVYIEEFDAGPKPIQGVGTSVAAFVGFTEKAPDSRPHLVTNWTQFTTDFGGYIPDSYLAYAVRGFFDNGGRQAYIVSVSNSMNGGSENGQKPRAALAASAAIPARLPAKGQSLQIEALPEGKAGEGIQVEIGPATGDGAAPDQFKMTVRQPGGPGKEETYDQLSFGKGKGVRNVEQVVNRESQLIRVKVLVADSDISVDLLPQVGLHTLQPAQPQAPNLPARIEPTDLQGNAEARAGVLGLEAIEEVNILCSPDLMSPRVLGDRDALTRIKTVQLAMLNHCEAMKNRFAILDAPQGMGVQDIKEWRSGGAGYDSMFGALYYPWIKVANQTPPAQRREGEGDLIEVPPCGHVAGVYARVDSERGVHKAPANEIVRGAVDLELQVTRNEQDLLNPIGINCIRSFPNMGIRIWGARTLSSDPAWRYINVRRLFNFVEESIDHSTQWVVFEPNDDDLWARVARDVTAFLDRVWRTGALFGMTPDEAFYVKCDRETNPPATRDVGQLICEIGLAPVKPAEFVVFRFTQKALEA